MNTPQYDPLEQAPLSDPNFDPLTVPFVKAIVDGSIPGVVVTPEDKDSPVLAPLGGNERTLFTKAGLVMQPLNGKAVIFNPDVIKIADIKKLDKARTLDQVLPPVSSLAESEGSSPAAAETAPAARPPIAMPSGGGGPVGPAAGPGVNKSLMNARLGNLSTGSKPTTQTSSPTSRILAGLRAPVV